MITGWQIQGSAAAAVTGPWEVCLDIQLLCSLKINGAICTHQNTNAICFNLPPFDHGEGQSSTSISIRKTANSASYLLVSVLCSINVILQELGFDLQLQVAQQGFISFLQCRDMWHGGMCGWSAKPTAVPQALRESLCMQSSLPGVLEPTGRHRSIAKPINRRHHIYHILHKCNLQYSLALALSK